MKPEPMNKTINKTEYDTDKATLVAGDDHFDGNNFERQGRNTFLYRTPKGKYFFVTQTQWQGETDAIEPATLDEAIQFYESCWIQQQRVMYADAFPTVKVEEG